jgi:hypothetical protein
MMDAMTQIETDEADDELVLPPTLQETKEAISALIGDVIELQSLVKMQFEGRRMGQYVDWAALKANQERIAEIQGDIAALKKHASGFREEEAKLLAERIVEKQKLKAENLAREAEIQRNAQAAKNDKRVLNAQLQERRESAAVKALLAYIGENLPDHLPVARAIITAARAATS